MNKRCFISIFFVGLLSLNEGVIAGMITQKNFSRVYNKKHELSI